jgi:hypothetical protein
MKNPTSLAQRRFRNSARHEICAFYLIEAQTPVEGIRVTLGYPHTIVFGPPCKQDLRSIAILYKNTDTDHLYSPFELVSKFALNLI